ncbi:unnamed protein product [Linum tenue]|uniref:Uncharacterized protein n=1 Tax=Linum tenue TaxID=586396 RepID=A0AAV0JL04_9ROSI|nr:unnamed protein product [Linum tenue]
MANQQPARPWFRAASLARPAQPPPQPTAPAAEVTAPPQPRPFRTLSTVAPPAANPPPVTRPTGPPALQPTAAAAQSARPTNGGDSVQASPAVRTDSIAASSLPSSPKPAITPAPTSSLPSSPVRKPAAVSSSVPGSPVQARKIFSVTNSPVRNPVPTVSSVPNSPKLGPPAAPPATKSVPEPPPRSVNPAAETPPQSPKRNPTAPPPSPLTLPPSQLKSAPEPHFSPEAEQKTVVLQKTAESQSATKKFWSGWSGSEGGAGNPLMGLRPKEENHKAKKNPSDFEDKGTKIITIAGENRGALMELFRSPRKSGNPLFPGNPRYLHRSPGTSSGSSSGEDGEGKKNKAERRGGSGTGKGAKPMSAVMNSNVQGINNSIMFNSSCSHNDPGVHVSLSRNPSDGGGGLHHGKDHRSNGYQS